ncbi:hypothetical protein COU57_03790 [Candidatus Pacearchaeota archaeon CG10_big_fil_rev_8_21_14_0_10_32_14]|nr:MAG: hypothetical protein COU57_03790 [Candidatus Pacearchaeota archaeon CG10_big_fil_rev_8_21_14_0_10_32_14]
MKRDRKSVITPGFFVVVVTNLLILFDMLYYNGYFESYLLVLWIEIILVFFFALLKISIASKDESGFYEIKFNKKISSSEKSSKRSYKKYPLEMETFKLFIFSQVLIFIPVIILVLLNYLFIFNLKVIIIASIIILFSYLFNFIYSFFNEKEFENNPAEKIVSDCNEKILILSFIIALPLFMLIFDEYVKLNPLISYSFKFSLLFVFGTAIFLQIKNKKYSFNDKINLSLYSLIMIIGISSFFHSGLSNLLLLITLKTTFDLLYLFTDIKFR